MPDAKAALVIGAGDATGGAIARRFAREGFTACVTRRNADKLAPLVARIESEGGKARAFGSDARKEEQMVALVDTIEREVGADRGRRLQHRRQRALSHPRDHGARLLQGLGDGLLWRLPDGPRGGQGHGAARPRHHPVHGRHRQRARQRRLLPPSPAPSTRLRALAQSMARELGPQGIHVAHVVIDGAIDTEFIRSNFPERAALKDRDGILSPEAIAEAYWQLHSQHRTAWTHEMDLRPWMETF